MDSEKSTDRRVSDRSDLLHSTMEDSVKKIKENVGEMTDDELSLLIHENQQCKRMFQCIFAVLVGEQVKRMNKEPVEIKYSEKVEEIEKAHSV